MAPKAKKGPVAFTTPDSTPALLSMLGRAEVPAGAAALSASQDVGATQIEPGSLLPSRDVSMSPSSSPSTAATDGGASLPPQVEAPKELRRAIMTHRGPAVLSITDDAVLDAIDPSGRQVVRATPTHVESLPATPAAITPGESPVAMAFPSSMVRSLSPSPCHGAPWAGDGPAGAASVMAADRYGSRGKTLRAAASSASASAPGVGAPSPDVCVPMSGALLDGESSTQMPTDPMERHARRLRVEVPGALVPHYIELTKAGIPEPLRRSAAALSYLAALTNPLLQ